MGDGMADDEGFRHECVSEGEAAGAQSGEEGEERQAEDGRVIARDALEEMDAEPLDLIGARLPTGPRCPPGEVAGDPGPGLKGRMARRALSTKLSSSSPPRARTTAECRCGCGRTGRRAGPAASPRSAGLWTGPRRRRSRTWSAPSTRRSGMAPAHRERLLPRRGGRARPAGRKRLAAVAAASTARSSTSGPTASGVDAGRRRGGAGRVRLVEARSEGQGEPIQSAGLMTRR